MDMMLGGGYGWWVHVVMNYITRIGFERRRKKFSIQARNGNRSSALYYPIYPIGSHPFWETSNAKCPNHIYYLPPPPNKLFHVHLNVPPHINWIMFSKITF